jgi:prepilin-type N-terminal cleavage/methylation domain-containing protein
MSGKSPKIARLNGSSRAGSSGSVGSPRGFTLVELLVVVVILAIMSTIVVATLQAAREFAKEAKTKATVGKLNNIILKMYDEYLTRRVPIDLSRTESTRAPFSPNQAAGLRLLAIRMLMLWEMPQCFGDILNNVSPASTYPIAYTVPGTNTTVQAYLPYSELAYIYSKRKAGLAPYSSWDSAKCLYLIVSTRSSDELSQFSNDEISYAPDGDLNWLVFVDAWGKPINFLRWAPGFTYTGMSDVQTGDPVNDHDPFDPLCLTSDYKLTPLIYSGGRDKMYGLDMKIDNSAKLDKICSGSTGAACLDELTRFRNTHFDNIHNHHIDPR